MSRIRFLSSLSCVNNETFCVRDSEFYNIFLNVDYTVENIWKFSSINTDTLNLTLDETFHFYMPLRNLWDQCDPRFPLCSPLSIVTVIGLI